MAANNLLTNKLKTFLLEANLIGVKKLEQLEAEMKSSGKSAEEIFAAEKIFLPAQFAEFKGKIYNLPVADLSDTEVDLAVLNLLTPKVAENYQMVVFERQENQIKVGLVDPENFQAHEAIEFMAQQQGFEPKYFIISLQDFRRIFGQYGSFKKEIGKALESAKAKFFRREEPLELKSGENMEEAVKAAPVAKIVSVIIKHALEGNASDIHIEPGRNEARVRYRVDGILHTSLVLPSYLHTSVVSRIKVLANLKLDETRIPQDGRIRFQLDNQDVDLRISVFPILGAEKVVVRVLNTSAGVPTLAELGFSDYHLGIIERNFRKPHGLFLLTGPTGSGKTTTLYSILNILNNEEYNITTLEDPVEYYINGVNQSQIQPEIGFTFAQGLRALLRQDPNIIMVGEIRDNETVELAIHASLTGHLVFSTLHTNNAWGALPRLIDMEAEPFLLSSTLNLIMAQRLVRKNCPNCQEEIKLPPNLENKIKTQIAEISSEFLKEFKGNSKFYQGKGCQNCAHSGYLGRTVIGEILEVGPELKEMISRENFSYEDIQNQLKKQKYLTLLQDGLLKALKGITSIAEILRAVEE